jgi:hypothetical protein
MIDEAGEGFEVDVNVNYASSGAGSSASEEVEENIGAELIHGAGLGAGSQTASDPVDAAGDGRHPMGWKVQSQQVTGPLRGSVPRLSAAR